MQEVASPEEDNNKKGLVLASLVILLILATVALNILIFSEEEEPQSELGQRSDGIHATAASLAILQASNSPPSQHIAPPPVRLQWILDIRWSVQQLNTAPAWPSVVPDSELLHHAPGPGGGLVIRNYLTNNKSVILPNRILVIYFISPFPIAMVGSMHNISIILHTSVSAEGPFSAIDIWVLLQLLST